MPIDYEVLGKRGGRDVYGDLDDLVRPEDQYILGDGAGAAGAGLAINALAELAQRGVQTYDDKQTADKAQAAATSLLDKATAADTTWAQAEQMAELSKTTDAQVKASGAMQVADAAGALLSSDLAAKRLANAQTAAKQSAVVAAGSPKDTARAAKAHAWAKVVAHLTGGADSGVPSKGSKESKSFFTATHAGLPMYAWIGGGMVLASGLLYLLLRRKK